METKKSKYDTNPLDPEVGRKAEESFGGGAPTQQVGGATREVGQTSNTGRSPDTERNSNESARQNIYSEAPTRRYDNPPLEAPYPSVFVPPTYAPPAQQYQQPGQQYQQPGQQTYQSPVTNRPTSRPVLGLGLSEKWSLILPYAPFYIGVIASLVELFMVPRREAKVRFHASQGLTLHIAILMIQTVLQAVHLLSGSNFGSALFGTAAFIFLIISMIRVWRGEPHRIPPLAEPAQWFNEHIEPRTRG